MNNFTPKNSLNKLIGFNNNFISRNPSLIPNAANNNLSFNKPSFSEKKIPHIKKMPTFTNLNIPPNFQIPFEKSNSFTEPNQNINLNQINHNQITNNNFNNINNININFNKPTIPNVINTRMQGIKIFGPLKPLNFHPNLTEGNNNDINANDINKLIILTKTFNINIVYYDESLSKTSDNNYICSYFKSQLEGTFYGINHFNLFKYICHKIQQNSKYFILISSGSSAEKLYKHCAGINMQQIYKCYIFCCRKEKYLPLMNICPRLKGVFNNFEELQKEVISNKNTFNYRIKSSNLIFLSDYNSTYIKFHFEIIRKYSLYKLLKNNNYTTSGFLEVVQNKKPYYMNLARELIFNDDEALVKFFKANTQESEFRLRQIFNHKHDIVNYISNYTTESFYYKYINKFLRKGDFDSFRVLSNHISKFIYHLYEYRKTHFQPSNLTLYRNMYISQSEFSLYGSSIGKVICYPSFISTSMKTNGYCPLSPGNNLILVKLVIQQNYSPSIVSIRDISEHPAEEEYLCAPFTFFKITNVECKTVNNIHTDTIYLTALNSAKPLEDMFLEFMENETDNLDPEGLQMIRLINNTTIILNPYLKAENYKKYDYTYN